jgi:hypothetical protein
MSDNTNPSNTHTHTLVTHHVLRSQKKFARDPPYSVGGVGKLGAAEASLLFPPCPDDPEGFATQDLSHQTPLGARSHKNFARDSPYSMGGVGKLGAAEASLLFPSCPNDPEGFATQDLSHQTPLGARSQKNLQGIPPTILWGVWGSLELQRPVRQVSHSCE